MNRHRGLQLGFTLVEVSIILLVLSVLSLVILPSLGTYLRDARLARARGDLAAIQRAVLQFLDDTGESAFRIDGNGTRRRAGTGRHDPPSPRSWNVVELLVSDGDIPDSRRDETRAWRSPVDGRSIDTLSNHLVENSPGDDRDRRYRTAEDLTNADPKQFPLDSNAGFNARFAWRGPYLAGKVRSDPWGNRYAVNVVWLDPKAETVGGPDSGHTEDVFVLSAGPDEELDTPFALDGVAPRDDDLIRIVWGDSR